MYKCWGITERDTQYRSRETKRQKRLRVISYTRIKWFLSAQPFIYGQKLLKFIYVGQRVTILYVFEFVLFLYAHNNCIVKIMMMTSWINCKGRLCTYCMTQHHTVLPPHYILTVWLTPHMKTLRIGSLDLNTLFFWCLALKCFFTFPLEAPPGILQLNNQTIKW